MKASELRIRNLIFDTISNQETVVDWVTIKVCYLEDDVYEPIPLTEEWLETKTDFTKNVRLDCGGHKRTPVWSLFSFSITIWDDGRLFYDWIGGNTELKFVHTLQNIYADLHNGKELTIKE